MQTHSQLHQKLPINKEKILNINVNVSGRVNPESGYSFSQFNFEERPLADVLSEKLGHKVTIDNDTRAMTYGEYMQGCVKGEKDIIFVNVSWGVGIGIIIDGKVYTGKSGFSGEFGHVNAYDNEIICHCGKKDVWKQKHPVLPFIVFFWNVSKVEKVLFFPLEYPAKKIPSRLTKLSQPSIRKICFALKLLKK